MPVLALSAMLALVHQCVPPTMAHERERLAAHAMVESGFNGGFDPLAVHDNTTNKTYHPDTVDQARQIVASLVAQGHSLDAGATQVNIGNWHKLGLTPERTLFDRLANTCGGAVIMIQDYEAACLYNTGKPHCSNGYPEAVDHAMAIIAQRNASPSDTTEVDPPPQQQRHSRCDDLPSYDLWAKQRCLENSYPDQSEGDKNDH